MDFIQNHFDTRPGFLETLSSDTGTTAGRINS
jgi:hypothetical protein